MPANVNFVLKANRLLNSIERRSLTVGILEKLRARAPFAAMWLNYVTGEQRNRWAEPLAVLDEPLQESVLLFVYFPSEEGEKCILSWGAEGSRLTILLSMPSRAIHVQGKKRVMCILASGAIDMLDEFTIVCGDELNVERAHISRGLENSGAEMGLEFRML